MTNDNDRHKKNTKTLQGMYLPEPDSEAGKRREKIFRTLDAQPHHRAKMKEKHARSLATFRAQLESGAGYVADEKLRCFLGEYYNRLMQFGSSYLPASFEVGEAFFDFPKEFAGLLLLSEEDYLISFEDFLSYVTEPDSPLADIGDAYKLKDRLIYNINNIDHLGELLMQTGSGSSFTMQSASVVRRGDELAVLMSLGELPCTETQELISKSTEIKFNSNKPRLSPSAGNQTNKVYTNPVMLEGAPELLQVIAMCRFNIIERRLEARNLMREMEQGFFIVTDVREVYNQLSPEKQEDLIQSGNMQLDAVETVWEIAKTLVLFPAYLSARVSFLSSENKSTRLALTTKNSLKVKRSFEKALPSSRIIFKRISAIRIERQAISLTGRSYTPPLFQVPVAGFWRYFGDSTRQGHDEYGNSVFGKTWIKPHLRHKDKEEPTSKVVYIKSSLTYAKRLLEKYKSQAVQNLAAQEGHSTTGNEESLLSEDASFVYVFRCPAHGTDIYKVGYTDRDPELRARELSSSTASPVQFLVVQAWAVTNGRLAESSAHKALESMRLSSNREFFQSKYFLLRAALEMSIRPWLLES